MNNERKHFLGWVIGGGILLFLLLPIVLAPVALAQAPFVGNASGWALVHVYQPLLLRLGEKNILRRAYEQNTIYWCSQIDGCELEKESSNKSAQPDALTRAAGFNR